MSQVSYWKVLTRKKTLSHDHESETKLSRVLSTFDLTALGVGATLGVGVYVLAGHVAKDQAGPSVVLSFLIAALASLLSGLCYAEFGARVPRAGSAYIYTYVCIGEFAAFIIGWNLILEYVIGSASVCRGISLYLDSLLNDTLKNTFAEVAPIHWGFLGTYFDFFAFTIPIFFGIALAFGIRTSAFLNHFCTIINVGVVIFVIIAGSLKADFQNWQIDPSTVNTTALEPGTELGAGGFFPFGFEGTLRGAATCFFGFVGFDCIATTGEEVRDPRKAIPRAILFSLLIIFVSYFGVSTVLTLMWPYYLQDVDAPLPYAFYMLGWDFAKWIVTVGGMLGLIASLLGALLPLPRIIYAMAQDGLIFRFLGSINSRFRTPIVGSICSAILTGIFAGLFDLTQLISILSIGTLLAYTVIAVCLTILRFMDNSTEYMNIESKGSGSLTEGSNLVGSNANRSSTQQVMTQIFNLKGSTVPTNLSTTMVTIMLLIYCVCCVAFSLTVMYASAEILNAEAWALFLLCFFGLIGILIVCAIAVQPREEQNPYFRVPLVPLLPAVSIFVNIYLMLQLDIYTWIRFAIWMVAGLVIYIPCICMYDRTNCETQHSIESYVNCKDNLEPKITQLAQDEYNNNYANSTQESQTLRPTPTVLVIKNELDQSTVESAPDQVANLKAKPVLDEILLESELSDSHKEMKHSNGDRYLIEHSEAIPPPTESDPDKAEEIPKNEADSAINILDDVLRDEDSETVPMNRQMSIGSEHIPSFHDVSIVAVVHRPSDTFKEENENENTPDDAITGSKDSGIEQDTEFVDKTPAVATNDENDLEVGMATANTELVNFEEDKLDEEQLEMGQNLNIEEVLLAGSSNLLINSPKVSKSHPDPEFQNYIEETPRQSIKSAPEIEEVSTPKVDTPMTGYTVVPIVFPGKTAAESSPNEVNKEVERPKSESPKVIRTQVPLKAIKSPTLSRKSSTSSTKSFKDPLHSETFREKLSRLMRPNSVAKVNIPPPPVSPSIRKADSPAPSDKESPKTAPAEVSGEKSLKPSKSEADIMHLVLNDIKSRGEGKELSVYVPKESSKTLNTKGNIPKPPKFDPILYKSLGARHSRQSKERPKLEDLVGKNHIPHYKDPSAATALPKPIATVEKEIVKAEEEKAEPEPEPTPEQFKKKLAAIIQRGPSFKIQKQYPQSEPSPPQRNSVASIKNDKANHKDNYAGVLQNIRDSKQKNANFTQNGKIQNGLSKRLKTLSTGENQSLEDVRKSLKSIT